MASVGGTLLAAPIALPAIVINVAGYVAVAGGVLTAVSQVVVHEDMPQNPKPTVMKKEETEATEK
ncbi:hypothetical protein [Mesonia sp. K7]|uniref:hypothetical protein n=1 Tax=Mesonia sp. K7 TaxID=2218606 RepID=UPI001F351FC8|nr:hypothetical protein [Mesonia sp. K7]